MNVEKTFIPEFVQHLRHMDGAFLRIIIQASADDAEAFWGQDTSMHLVG